MNSDSLASKSYNLGRKSIVDKKGPKYFSSGGTDHFAMDFMSKKTNINEDYEVKYKKLLASLKRKNIDLRVLTIEEESREDDEIHLMKVNKRKGV